MMPIVPLEIFEPVTRTMLIYDVAEIIGDALSGTEDIRILEVAEMIVDQIEESLIFHEKGAHSG